MHVFKHPKYYKELRKRNRDLSELQQETLTKAVLERSVPQSDQVISKEPATAGNQRAPGPGLKQQATSNKRQAPSSEKNKPQAPSPKRQASS